MQNYFFNNKFKYNLDRGRVILSLIPLRIKHSQASRKLNYIKIIRTNTTSQMKLNPFFVTGFIDGEGSFMISIFRLVEYKGG